MKLKSFESRNLIPFFHSWLLKSRKENPDNFTVSLKSQNQVPRRYVDINFRDVIYICGISFEPRCIKNIAKKGEAPGEI